MTTTEIPPTVSEPPSRPAPPDRSRSRWARRVIGIREDVLDWAPEERPRYTRTGLLVLITGMLAGLSMLVLTTRVFDGWLLPLAVALALFWGMAITVLDSWLLASLHGARARLLVCLPRLAFAAVLGFFIAEPLVVLMFRPTVAIQVADNRRAELAEFSSSWKACNPPGGDPSRAPECADRQLNLASSPGALRAQRDHLNEQRTRLQGEVSGYLARWEELERIARAECTGARGPNTTGVRGEGPECSRNRRIADQYRRDTRLDQRQADLNGVDQELVRLTEALRQAEREHGGKVTAAIADRVAEWQASRGSVGLLEELRALGQVAARSTEATLALWALRLVLILFDCLPVLTKLMGGGTSYDELIRNENRANELRHQEALGMRVRDDAARLTEREQQATHRRRQDGDELIERIAEAHRARFTQRRERGDGLAPG